MKNPDDAYDNLITTALPAMLKAEEYGARCAEHFVIFLNAAEEPAPNGKSWNPTAYLKARKRLHEKAVATPPLDYQSARDNRIGHDGRRAQLLKKLAQVGDEYRWRKSHSGKLLPFA